MLKQTCTLFPQATCITDNCKCSAKLDVDGVEPKCNPGKTLNNNILKSVYIFQKYAAILFSSFK